MYIRGIDKLTPQELNVQLEQGARFVYFEYCVSLLFLTWRQPTDIFFLRPGQQGILVGWPYLLMSFFLGWWGIPWGLILTPQVLYLNLCGGRDVTAEVAALLQTTGMESPVHLPQQKE